MKVPHSVNDAETSSMLSFLETLVVSLLKVEIQIVLTINKLLHLQVYYFVSEILMMMN